MPRTTDYDLCFAVGNESLSLFVLSGKWMWGWWRGDGRFGARFGGSDDERGLMRIGRGSVETNGCCWCENEFVLGNEVDDEEYGELARSKCARRSDRGERGNSTCFDKKFLTRGDELSVPRVLKDWRVKAKERKRAPVAFRVGFDPWFRAQGGRNFRESKWSGPVQLVTISRTFGRPGSVGRSTSLLLPLSYVSLMYTL